MKLSARNQFAGKVAKIQDGAVNGIVTIDVNGTPVSATISMAAIKELGLVPGKELTPSSRPPKSWSARASICP